MNPFIHTKLAIEIIQSWKAPEPMHVHLKNFFRKNKQCGSKDRKNISQLVYSYYRIGKALNQKSLQEKLLAGTILTNSTENTAAYSENLSKQTGINLAPDLTNFDDKYKNLITVFPEFSLDAVFPYRDQLSKGINFESYAKAYFEQPQLFIRCKPDHIQSIFNELKVLKTPYKIITDNILQLSARTSLNNLDSFKKSLFEIQDYSSVMASKHIQPKKNEIWWDCCAGSGGKTLSLLENIPDLKLFASDIRTNILENLKSRLEKNAYKNVNIIKADLETGIPKELKNIKFDGIVLDAPCSGSGTWHRTPEQLSAFKSNQIQKYTNRQIKIAKNVCMQLKENGCLYYITCSVFKQENEEMVKNIEKETGLKCELSQIIPGYDLKADSFFVAKLLKC